MLPWDSRVLDSNTYTCDLTVGSDNEINTVLERRWVCDYGLYPVREYHIVVLGLRLRTVRSLCVNITLLYWVCDYGLYVV